MRFYSLLLAAAMTVAAIHSSAAEQPMTNRETSDEATVRDLEARSWLAWKDHDATFFDQFLSDDHVEIHGYGIVGKAAVVRGVGSGVCVVQRFSLGPMSVVAIAPDAALVTYRAEQDTRCGSANVPSPVWATSLYVRRGGRWVNVLYQQTPIT